MILNHKNLSLLCSTQQIDQKSIFIMNVKSICKNFKKIILLDVKTKSVKFLLMIREVLGKENC